MSPFSRFSGINPDFVNNLPKSKANIVFMNLYATCPDEMTGLLAEELENIGAKGIKTGYRVVYFQGGADVYYKAHLHLRLASRVFRIIKEIPAGSPRIIFDKTKRINFSELFAADMPVKIGVVSASTKETVEGHLAGSKIREALDDSFKHFAGKTPTTSSRDAKVSLRAFLNSKRMMLSLDTSFQSLHKRGFRMEGHPAPLKETLAAALLRAIGYDGSQNFLDPMCGSGTIIIEAAQIAINKAPLIHRKKGEFGFEFLKDFDSSLWRSVQENARQGQIKPRAGLFARDIDKDYLEIAKQSALKGRVEKYINFAKTDFFASTKPAETGIMVANFPYGLRLDEQSIDKAFLRKAGDHLKQNFKGWTCGILLPEASPYKEIGLKPEKRLSLLNGSVKVKFLVFSIY